MMDKIKVIQEYCGDNRQFVAFDSYDWLIDSARKIYADLSVIRARNACFHSTQILDGILKHSKEQLTEILYYAVMFIKRLK